MKKVVILNCPPRSGKDTMALEISKETGCGLLSFKGKLIEIALLVSGVPKNEWEERYESDDKELPWDRLGGLSQRNYLIKISEEWVKPVHGNTYFGDRVLEDVQRGNLSAYIIPDGGFKEEVLPLKNDPNINLLILQWNRDGCSYDYDSRDFVMDYPEITRRIRDNNTTIREHVEAMYDEINNFFGEYQ